MKTMFLVITSNKSEKNSTWAQREQYVRDFYFGLKDMVPDTDVAYTTYDDIECLVQNGKVTITDTRTGMDLKDAGLVHFKNWLFDSEQAAMLAFYLREHGVRFFNSEVDAGLAWGKISQMVRLAMAGLAVPDTYFARKSRLTEAFRGEKLLAGFRFPLIMKADDGAKGNDNHLLRDVAEALAVLESATADKEYVLQNFIPNDGDYRLLFTGLQDDPLVFIRKSVAGSHLNNTSQGGTGQAIDVAKVPKDYIVMARRAAETLNRQISGVDIIVNRDTTKPYILEVNSTPALATGYDVPTKQIMFAQFLKEQFKGDA